MCLGIPGQIIQVADSALQLAVVDVSYLNDLSWNT